MVKTMVNLRDTLAVLLEADVGAADRDAVAGLLRQSRELRSWLDSFDVRCVRRTSELAAQGRSEPAESMGTDHGLSARESRQARLRAEACDLFVLFERALTRGDIAAGHVDALAMAIRDLNDEQRFGLIDREERLLEAAMRMRVDDFVRHCRVQAADVVAELARNLPRRRPRPLTSRATLLRAPMSVLRLSRPEVRRRRPIRWWWSISVSAMRRRCAVGVTSTPGCA